MSGRTILEDGAYQAALPAVLEHLRAKGRITNTMLRSLTGFNYDLAIKFFNRGTSSGVLERRGKFGGTYYVLRESGS